MNKCEVNQNCGKEVYKKCKVCGRWACREHYYPDFQGGFYCEPCALNPE